MADAREATAGDEGQTSTQEAVVFKSVKAALAAVERGEACLHLDLTKPSYKDQSGRRVSSKMTPEELAESVNALPRLTQLKTLLLACKSRVECESQTTQLYDNVCCVPWLCV